MANRKDMRTRLPLAAAFLLGLIVLATIPVSALHWEGNGNLNPYTVYQGVFTTFDFTVVNQASGSLDVYWVFAHFCWNPAGWGYYFKQSDGTTDSVPGGGSYTWSRTIQVDSGTLGSCQVDIEVRGRAVGDLAQETATYVDVINVVPVPPLQLSTAANPTTGTAPLTVSFSSTVTGGLAPYTYAWTFGDGGTSSLSDPSHTYQSGGTYTASLVVTDSQGTQRSDSRTITVNAPIPPVTASVAADPTTGTVPLTIAFSVSVSGGRAPYTLVWDFGDGGTSVQQNPTHTYQVSGTYSVTVVVSDADGRQTSESITITVNPSPLTGTNQGIPPWALYAAAIGGASVLGAVVLIRRRKSPRAPPPP